jgi:hypothetical protein
MPIEIYSKKLKRLSQSGQPDVYQYDEFPRAFRVQVTYVWGRTIGRYDDPSGWREINPCWDMLHNALAEEYGVHVLAPGANSQDRCETFLFRGSSDQVLDIIDLSFGWIEAAGKKTRSNTSIYKSAIDDLNYRFQEHSIGFEFVDNQLIRKDSQFLHQEAVKPALALLNNPGFTGPQDEFLRAHSHLRTGEYQDAIIDANNAFESTMKAICDLRGWVYDKTATAKTLIGLMFDNELIPHSLSNHFDHLRLVLEAGLPTVRNKTSSHGQGSIPVVIPEYLAAYALHLTASNIVFLVGAHQAKP